jgi:hypothetical protein
VVSQANPIHLTQSFNTNLTQVMIMPNINIKRGQNSSSGGGLSNGDPNNSNIMMANLLKKHQHEFNMAQGKKLQNNSKSVGNRSNQQ